MNGIPTNEFTLSKEEGWDKFTIPKVQKWVRENLYGKRARINVCMVKCKIEQDDPGSKPDEWTVTPQVAGIPANYFGLGNRVLPIDKADHRIPYLTGENPNAPPPSIGVEQQASFSFKCPEAEARKWDAYSKKPVFHVMISGGIMEEPAFTVTIEGDIAAIFFLPHVDSSLGDFIGYDIFVQLEHFAVLPSKESEPLGLYACEYALFVMSRDGSSRCAERSHNGYQAGG